MRTLEVTVSDRKVSIVDPFDIPTGNIETIQVKFTFVGEVWNGIKKMVKFGSYEPIEIHNGIVSMPIMIERGNTILAVYGYKSNGDEYELICSPVPTYFSVVKGSFDESGIAPPTPVPPTPSGIDVQELISWYNTALTTFLSKEKYGGESLTDLIVRWSQKTAAYNYATELVYVSNQILATETFLLGYEDDSFEEYYEKFIKICKDIGYWLSLLYNHSILKGWTDRYPFASVESIVKSITEIIDSHQNELDTLTEVSDIHDNDILKLGNDVVTMKANISDNTSNIESIHRDIEDISAELEKVTELDYDMNNENGKVEVLSNGLENISDTIGDWSKLYSSTSISDIVEDIDRRLAVIEEAEKQVAQLNQLLRESIGDNI